MINDEKSPELEQDENETQEVESTEETSEETTTQTETSHEDDKDWKAEALKYKAILDRNKNKPEYKEPSKKSDDFGYDVKAYLKTSGINSNEFDFVKTELKQSGYKDVDSLLENDYFKARLDKFRNEKKTIEATPTGKRSGGVPTDSVEYWAAKPIEEVPADMRIKVVNYQLQKEKNKGVFYNS